MSDDHLHPSSAITRESAEAFLPGSFPGDLGIEPLEIEDTHSRGRIVVDQRHLHPGGFVHGGVWTALGDTVAAWATFRSIPPRHNFTTIELKLNVFAAGLLGDEIVAVARAASHRQEHGRDRGPDGAPPRGRGAAPGGEPDRQPVRAAAARLAARGASHSACSSSDVAGRQAFGGLAGFQRPFEAFDLGQAPERAGDRQADRGREQGEEPLAGAEQLHFEEVADRREGEDQRRRGAPRPRTIASM